MSHFFDFFGGKSLCKYFFHKILFRKLFINNIGRGQIWNPVLCNKPACRNVVLNRNRQSIYKNLHISVTVERDEVSAALQLGETSFYDKVIIQRLTDFLWIG